MVKLNKTQVIQAFVQKIQSEIEGQSQSARSAHQAATHEESRAEDRHDTFAIEASYLAAGQSARIFALEKLIVELKTYLEDVRPDPLKVVPGTVVLLETAGKTTYSLFARAGGGNSIMFEGLEISVVTPASPLGDALKDAEPEESIEVETKSGIKTYRVLRII